MSLLLFVVFLGACFAAGSTGALFPPGDWYQRLRKPRWVPPNWAFPVVWITLYLLMSFAGARVAEQDGAGLALAFWSLQIAFNVLWTPVFFGLRRLKASLSIMLGLWVSVAGALLTHMQVDLLAGLAFVPYLIWVSVAMALNIEIWRLNPAVTPLRPDQI